MDGKTKAIVAHITIIGWIIAFVMNSNDKDKLTSYYIRQMLGLFILGFVLYIGTMVITMIIPKLGGLLSLITGIGMLVLWIMSLLGALSGEEKPMPIIGEQIQDIFKGIS